MKWQQSERQPALVAHPPAASLDEAHGAIELWEFYSRKTLDAEQRLAVELMMAETDDGRWAADTTGRAESRQNGKGDEIEVVELYGLTQRAEAILHTAHEAATAASAHVRLVGLIESHRDLRNKLRPKGKKSWNGNYSLAFNNDAVIVWRTRTGAGGRGLDDISRIVVDEAQHAQPEELASSLPILSVNPNPQKNFLGSGGIRGKSAFWWRLRLRGLRPAGRFSWLEHSAETITLGEDGKIVTSVGDVADPATWMRANPAYPSRISHDFLLDQLETLGPELFAREHLCVWDAHEDESEPDIDVDAWLDLEDVEQTRPTPVAFSVSVSEDRKWSSIGLAGVRSDGEKHIQIVQAGRGTAWVSDRMVELKKQWKPVGVAIAPAEPAGSLIPQLEAAGIDLLKCGSREYAQACGMLMDGIDGGTVHHSSQAQLNVAIGAARKAKSKSSDAFSFVAHGDKDIAPLKAVALALYGLERCGTSKRSGRVW